ncbi:hypothetical protein BDW22DRAFT_1181293 [Trametopsis cervina]|nr:hypothetical protein BDW22DRAFT_1181293 [Trametopsis cervina]
MPAVTTPNASSQNVTLPHIPELYDPAFLDKLLPLRAAPESSHGAQTPVTNSMMDALKAVANRTRTDKNSPAYSSTGSDTLDAFQVLRPGYNSTADLNEKLRRAWREDPEITLRMIWQCRSILDGKGERETFYRAFGWLYKNHPRTAIQNLSALVTPLSNARKGKKAAHGYWKDLSNIVALAAVGELTSGPPIFTFLHNYQRPIVNRRRPTRMRRKPVSAKTPAPAVPQAQSRQEREAKNAHFHEQLVSRLSEPKFRALFIMVARLFADRLAEDIRLLDRIEELPSGDERRDLVFQVSLAGKWAPSPGRSHDRVTNLSTAIAFLLYQNHQLGPTFSRPLDTELPIDDVHALRSFYRRWVLMPLRKVLSCPEPLMSAKRWTEILYSRVPATCMKLNKTRFFEHDPQGFESYLISVESGKRKISGATLMPHEIIADLVQALKTKGGPVPHSAGMAAVKMKWADIEIRTLEAQWKTLVQNLRESGALENALAICDVSGSMGHLLSAKIEPHSTTPILPSIALSLIVAQLAKPPFANHFITFSETPELVVIDQDASLPEIIEKMAWAPWGMNTDLNAVFLKLLLPAAKLHNLKQEDMIKRLFVFTDMQFDDAQQNIKTSSKDWDTNHDVIEQAYKEAGYEMPQIVYWNLNAGRDAYPVLHDRKGVALMNGFSPALLKVFMGEVDPEEVAKEEGWDIVTVEATPEKASPADFNPMTVMKMSLSKASFDGLIVVD